MTAPAAQPMNHELKTPQPLATSPQSLRGTGMCQEALWHNKMTKPTFISRKEVCFADDSDLGLPSVLFSTKSTVISATSHPTVTSRAEEAGRVDRAPGTKHLKDFLDV